MYKFMFRNSVCFNQLWSFMEHIYLISVAAPQFFFHFKDGYWILLISTWTFGTLLDLKQVKIFIGYCTLLVLAVRTFKLCWLKLMNYDIAGSVQVHFSVSYLQKGLCYIWPIHVLVTASAININADNDNNSYENRW